MKISFKWLTDYIDIDLSMEELAQKITNAGIEVEEIIPLVKEYQNIILAKVESVKKHPDADKLSLCQVWDGDKTIQVICGAPNVQSGQLVAYAQIGAKLPNGLKIKKAKIRGIESFGMICSKEELGIEEKSDGIWPITTEFKAGADINDVLQEFRDYIFDLFITSNRPDCLCHYGIAREVSAFTGKPLKTPKIQLQESSSFKVSDKIKVSIKYADGCPRYAARYIQNVKVGPSPKWLTDKLNAIGSRSINNVVDITNFILQELGQPLHAFDYDKIAGQQIFVRNSKAGNKFSTLDGKERILPANTVMICDAEREVALGGIMGGLNSEVSESTTNILLESAYFNPVNIVQSTRNLNLVTDASIRFEKGTDYENVIFALDRATQLIQELAGGEIAEGVFDEYPATLEPVTVPFRPERVNRILGTQLDETKIKDALSRLNLKKTKDGYLIPSYRVDLNKEVDLIEEVARMINLDEIPTSTSEPLFLDQEPDTNDILFSVLRQNLVEAGLFEVFTNSMISYKQAQITHEKQLLKILNPISDELSTLRPSLLQGIMATIVHNKNRNNNDLKIFEMGRVFYDKTENDLPEQPIHFSIALTGSRNPEFWDRQLIDVSFYDIKGIIEQLFDNLLLKDYHFQSITEKEYFDPDFSVKVLIANEEIGILGRLNKQVLKAFDIKSDVYFSEFNFGSLKKYISLHKKYNSIGKYPYIEKDLALLLENNIQSAAVINQIEEQGGRLLKSIDIFDVYSNKKMNPDQKSIAFRLKFQSSERTLTDEEVDQIFRKIIKSCENAFNAKLRES